jgi:hypothetical protein
MRDRTIIRTTLGELVAAVVDEVKPFIRDPSTTYMVASCVLSELFDRHLAQVHTRAPKIDGFAKPSRRQPMSRRLAC